jgi:uncharacterized membrane protein YphA (DoxX/SURF4 family)
MRIVGPGHALFAVAAAGLAILSLAYRDFAPMWQALPASFPGRGIWVYACALLVLAASAGLCFSRTALPSVVTIGAYLAAWAVTRVGPIVAKPLGVDSWYGLFEALGPLAAAWILYAMLRSPLHAPTTSSLAGERAVRVARVVFGLACVAYGVAHFAYAEYTASMVPAWLPGRMELAYVTGLGHIAAGIGVTLGILPRLAATLEAIMMSLFGVLVWMPSLWAQPRPEWATPPQNQGSEIVVTLLLAASAWIVAISLRNRRWGLASNSGA